jgi:hypothetical protein
VEKGKENWSAFDTTITILENGGNFFRWRNKKFRLQQFKELSAAKKIQLTHPPQHIGRTCTLTKHDKQSKHIVYITKQN